jgi:hypothetical protein
MNSVKIEGRDVKPGDWICFKSDIEQGGRIVEIRPASRYLGRQIELILENENGFQGAYIGGDTQTVVRASDCWVN